MGNNQNKQFPPRISEMLLHIPKSYLCSSSLTFSTYSTVVILETKNLLYKIIIHKMIVNEIGRVNG